MAQSIEQYNSVSAALAAMNLEIKVAIKQFGLLRKASSTAIDNDAFSKSIEIVKTYQQEVAGVTIAVDQSVKSLNNAINDLPKKVAMPSVDINGLSESIKSLGDYREAIIKTSEVASENVNNIKNSVKSLPNIAFEASAGNSGLPSQIDAVQSHQEKSFRATQSMQDGTKSRGFSDFSINDSAVAINSDSFSSPISAMQSYQEQAAETSSETKQSIGKINKTAKSLSLSTSATSLKSDGFSKSIDAMQSYQEEIVETSSEAERGVNTINKSVNSMPADPSAKSPKQDDENNKKKSGGGNFIKNAAKGIVDFAKESQFISKGVGLADDMTLANQKINTMNDGMQSNAELQKMIVSSANSAGSSYMQTLSTVSSLNSMSNGLFSNNEEAVSFTELMDKTFKTSGLGIEEQNAAMQSLVDSMSQGTLEGDGFNNVLQNAPALAQAIASTMGTSVEQLPLLAEQGKISAETVKTAMFGAAGGINSAFANMPMTFGQNMEIMKNNALMALQPIFEKISEIINSPQFKVAADKFGELFSKVVDAALVVIDGLGKVYKFVEDNWSWIEPIVTAVAIALGVFAIASGVASIAQAVFNSALFSCPLVWIIGLIILLIVLMYVFFEQIYGVQGWIEALMTNIGLGIANVALGIWEVLCSLCKNIGAVFENLWKALQQGFSMFLIEMMKGTRWIIDTFGEILGFPLTSEMLTVAIENEEKNLNKIKESYKSFDNLGEAWDRGFNTHEYRDLGEAYSKNASIAKAAKENFESIFTGKLSAEASQGSVAQTGLSEFMKVGLEESGVGVYSGQQVNSNDKVNVGHVNSVGKVDNEVEVSSEDIKLMRDLAEQQAIQNFVSLTPNITVTTGDINQNADSDYLIGEIERVLIQESNTSIRQVYAYG